jgi:hypothetical protein
VNLLLTFADQDDLNQLKNEQKAKANFSPFLANHNEHDHEIQLDLPTDVNQADQDGTFVSFRSKPFFKEISIG